MARTRTPEHLRSVKGMDKKNPSRRNPDQPTPPSMGIGPPPSYMSDSECSIWDEVVSQMPARVLGSSDRIAFEIMVRIVNETRLNFADVTGAKLSQLNSLLSRFGMTPSDRSKIVLPQEKTESIYEKYKK